MAYGLEINNSAGETIVTISDDLSALATSGTIAVPPGSTTSLIPVTGMSNTPQWEVILLGSTLVPLLYVTKQTGGFTITNDNTQSGTPTIRYWVVRLG